MRSDRTDTISKLAPLQLTFGTSILSIAAAMGSLEDPDYIRNEVKRNDAARRFTLDFFSGHGLDPVPSHTNFVFVNIGRSAKEFREACAERGHHGRKGLPSLPGHSRPHLDRHARRDAARDRVFAEVLGLQTADNQQ